jgi:transposase-like protein
MGINKSTIPLAESPIIVEPLFTEAEVLERHKDYATLDDVKFDKAYRDFVYKPITINYGAKRQSIQYNFCTDTFCPNYGQPIKVVGKATMGKSIKSYKLVKASKSNGKPAIQCNIMSHAGTTSPMLTHTSTLLSNWGIANEIRRLKTLEALTPQIDEYIFHKVGCTNTSSPYENSKSFIKKGKNASGSQKYECKVCGKRTSVKLNTVRNFGFNQKRDEVMLPVFRDILFKMPITKICERNHIAPVTFYRKLERIYQRCLEFNERHEKKLKSIEFDDLYLNIDSFVYNLNNIRRRNEGGTIKDGYEKTETKDALTYMTATVEIKSNYVFRSDLSYSSDTDQELIESDTLKYHCDHTYPYLRKNQHVRKYTYAPQPPSTHDKQTYGEYLDKYNEFETRKKFVEGLHINRSYTTLAQHDILRNNLSFNRVIFVTDKDASTQSAIFRVYKDDFQNDEAVYLTCDYMKESDYRVTWAEAQKQRRKLDSWAKKVGLDEEYLFDQSEAMILNTIEYLDFYKMTPVGKLTLPKRSPIKVYHPLPSNDEGNRIIELQSYNPTISKEDLAVIMNNVTIRPINNFFQELRRDNNLLERPLVSARGSGKTYIYANYNPKYAHMLIQIYRTYYNFIQERSYYDKKKMTPAQRIGIVKRKYIYEDIIYMK